MNGWPTTLRQPDGVSECRVDKVSGSHGSRKHCKVVNSIGPVSVVKVGDAWDGSTKANLRSVILLAVNIIFILLGSLGFQQIENNHRYTVEVHNSNLSDDLEYFMEKHQEDNKDNTSYHHRPFTQDEWDKLKELHSKQCYKIDNVNTQKRLWNFWSSLDFCATVLTTIGYGNMYPKTDMGRYFTILYSLLGIPLMALYLTIFSKGIYRMTSWTMRHFFIFLNKKVLMKFRSKTVPPRTRSAVTNAQFKISSLLFLATILAAFVLGFSWLLHVTNEYDSFLACTYFYLMTLTTVGTGDISMTEHNAFVLFRVLLIFCVGLTLVTVVFSAIRNLLLENKRAIRRATSKLRSTAFLLGTYQRVRRVSQQVKRRVSGAGPSIVSGTQRISQTFSTMLKRQSRSSFTGAEEMDQGDVMHAEGGILLAECGILHLEGRVNAIVEEDEISSISSCGTRGLVTL